MFDMQRSAPHNHTPFTSVSYTPLHPSPPFVRAKSMASSVNPSCHISNLLWFDLGICNSAKDLIFIICTDTVLLKVHSHPGWVSGEISDFPPHVSRYKKGICHLQYFLLTVECRDYHDWSPPDIPFQRLQEYINVVKGNYSMILL